MQTVHKEGPCGPLELTLLDCIQRARVMSAQSSAFIPVQRASSSTATTKQYFSVDLNPSLHYLAYDHLYLKMPYPTKKQNETKSIKAMRTFK